MIYGNTEGLRQSFLEELEVLYEVELERKDFLPVPLVNRLARYTEMINREIAVYIGRGGEVLEVSLGEVDSVRLSDIRLRRNTERLSGVRCIHTHPGGNPHLSLLDIQALKHMLFDSMAAIGVRDGRATAICAAFLGDEGEEPYIFGPVPPWAIPQEQWISEIRAADMRVKPKKEAVSHVRERAILIGTSFSGGQESMDELARLADTAGAEVIASELQTRPKPDIATYIGSGKVQEVARMIQEMDADTVIINDELTGAQLRNLEEAFGKKVIDRTMLILDIFALRARSREGKLQVHLAQLKYQLPRLAGWGAVLSRQSGGIGTRGPGETKMETDRRHINRQIIEMTEALENVKKQRAIQRRRREARNIPVVALVGYTNAGKSTLLSALSGSDTFIEDRLFATLDPLIRQINLENGERFLLVDTVGFIDRLPHDLVNAFNATLEETLQADLLLHVMDASSENVMKQKQVVEQVLQELGAGETPCINVLNKTDLALPDDGLALPDGIRISAARKIGLDRLLEEIVRQTNITRHKIKLTIPYQHSRLLDYIYKNGRIYSQEHTPEGTEIEVMLDSAALNYIERVLKGQRKNNA